MTSEKHRNPDGTYNGVSFMAEISGLSEAEIKWTFDTTKKLLAEGRSKGETKRIIREWAHHKPWERT